MTVSDQIIQVLDALCEKFGMAIDWTGENVLPYVELLCTKLVTWKIWTSVASIVLAVALSIASVIATKKLYPIFKRKIENQRSWEDGWTVGAVVSIIGLVVLNSTVVIGVGCQIMNIIKCVTFPEMFIFEYIQGVINGG